jgi:uncharacterized protein
MDNPPMMKVSQVLSALVGSVLSLSAEMAFATSSGLVDSAQQGDRAAVQAVLKRRAEPVDQAGRDGMTALLWAVQADDLAMAKALLKAKANPDLPNRYGITPLWMAALNRSPEMVKLLLKSGANARATLPNGETALMIAGRAGDPVTIRLLLEAGADANASESLLGETALMWAASENHPDAIHALVKGGADIDRHSRVLQLAEMNWDQVGMVSTTLPSGSWTAAMYAARQNSAEAMAALIALGANLDEQDGDGTTALSLAIMNEHYDLAATLLEAGADPKVADHTGTDALFGAVEMVTFRPDVGRPPRPSADRLKAKDIVGLALKHGANPNARLVKPTIGRHHAFSDRSLGEGATPLMKAAKGGDLETMRMLLVAGADPALKLAKGDVTVFDIAAGKVATGAALVGGRGTKGAANEAMQNLLKEFEGKSAGAGPTS